MTRQLFRCSHDRRIAGVAAGIAEYLDIDVTLVRVVWFVSIFFGGFGLLLYILLALVVPLEPAAAGADGLLPPPPAPPPPAPSGHHHVASSGGATGGALATFAGIALVLFGTLALLDELLPDWANGGRFVGPAFILGLGILFLVTVARRGTSAP